jgi:hypothetical protein
LFAATAEQSLGLVLDAREQEASIEDGVLVSFTCYALLASCMKEKRRKQKCLIVFSGHRLNCLVKRT